MTRPAPSFLFRPLRLFRLSSWFRWVIGSFLAIGGVVGAVGVNVYSRAASSYREGESALFWARDPAGRTRNLEAEFLKASERLSAQKERGRLTDGDLRLEQDILQVQFDMRSADSSAKRAYFLFRNVYERYSLPETRISRYARLLAPAAKMAWREDVAKRGLLAPDRMFDLAPGEGGDRWVVYSTRDPHEAANVFHRLQEEGISAHVMDDQHVRGAARVGFWITVPTDSFWTVHQMLKNILAPDLPPVLVETSTVL
jgi:hypothetical protein